MLCNGLPIACCRLQGNQLESKAELTSPVSVVQGNTNMPDPGREESTGAHQLDSWKEIAAYLQRDVSTVIRWEKKEGLPVRRHVHNSLATVYAHRSEIDAWLANRRPDLEKDGLPHWSAPVQEHKKTVAGITIGIGLVVLIGLVWWVKPDFFAANEPGSQSPTKFVITPLARRGSIDVVISPDGKRVVYLAQREYTRQLYVRPLDQFEARPIPGTEGAEAFPFFSPDGEWLAFHAAGKLKKVSLRGGAPLTLCEVDSGWFGGAWNSQDTIVFAAREKGGPGSLYRVAATGGAPKRVATPDPEQGELRYTCPKFLPGGKALFFDAQLVDAPSSPQIRVLALETGEQKIVVEEGVNPYYAPTGHLVYQAKGMSLMAAPFDLATLAVTGDSVLIREGIRGVDYALSGDGTLVYVPRAESDQHLLVWVDRQGKERVVSQESREYHWPRISPDGRQVALTIIRKG